MLYKKNTGKQYNKYFKALNILFKSIVLFTEENRKPLSVIFNNVV